MSRNIKRVRDLIGCELKASVPLKCVVLKNGNIHFHKRGHFYKKIVYI